MLAHPIVAFLYQRGRFGAEAVAWTAATLPYQALGILFVATARISTQALNALKDYRGPAQAAVLGFACNIAFSLLLMGPMGTSGIALANSLAALVGLGYQELRLRRALGRLPYGEVLRGWGAFALCAAGMGLLAFLGARMAGLATFHGFLGTGFRLLPLIGLSALAYAGLALALRVREAGELVGALRRRLPQRR